MVIIIKHKMTKLISFAALSLIASVALAEQPAKASNPIYDCAYNENDDVKVEIVMANGKKSICGLVDGENYTMNIDDFTDEPTVSLIGDNVDESVFYSLFLLSATDSVIGLMPIMH